MAILKKEFGVMPSGEKVYEYTLTNKKGISASFIDLGLSGLKCWYRIVMKYDRCDPGI